MFQCNYTENLQLYKVKIKATGRGGPRGSGKVKAPNFLDIQHYKGGRSSAICTGRL